MNFKPFIFWILLVLCTGFVIAQEDFSAYSDQATIKICSCETVTNEIAIRNSGIITSNYEVTKAGSAKNFATITPGLFSLNSLETKELYSFITAPCNARGNYELITQISTDLGLVKSMVQKVEIQPCNNIRVIPIVDTITTCPCSLSEFEIEIQNTRSHSEIYSLKALQYSDSITFSENAVLLQPGEKVRILIYANLPCEIFGEKSIDIVITALHSGFTTTFPLMLSIEACYDYQLTSQQDVFELCATEPEVYGLTLSNNADFINSYDFAINGPEWVALNPGTTTLAGQDSQPINIQFSPTLSDVGVTNISILAVSRRGNIAKEIPLQLDVKECYKPKIIINKTEKTVCCGGKNIPITVANLGRFNEEVLLQITGPNWTTISQTEVELSAGQQTEIYLSANPSCDISGNFDITINAFLVENRTTGQDNTEVVFFKQPFSTDSIKLEVHDQASCDAVEFIGRKAHWIGLENSTIKLQVQQKGLRPTRYYIDMVAPSWINIESTELYLEPGQTKSINLFLSPGNDILYGAYAYNISLVTLGTQTEINYDAGFVVTIQKSLYGWMKSNIIPILITILLIILLLILLLLIRLFKKKPKTEAIKKGTNKIVEKKETKKVVEKKKTEAKPAKKEQKKDQPKRSWWTLLLIMLFIILLAFFIWLDYGKNSKDTNTTITTESTTTTTQALLSEGEALDRYVEDLKDRGLIPSFQYVVIEENGKETIDLGKHFYDPDVDQLSFSVTDTDNITASINEESDIATITPDKDFIGIRTIGFVADDSKGGTTSSPTITVIVTEAKQPKWQKTFNAWYSGASNKITSFFSSYKYYILFGIILAVIVVVLLATITPKETPKKKK